MYTLNLSSFDAEKPNYRPLLVNQNLGHKKKASPFYRTATTVCLCCLPALEDLTGAGRKRLALCRQKYIAFNNTK